MFSLQPTTYNSDVRSESNIASDLQPKHRRGFTLVELLTVITIIGLMSTIATVSYESVRAKSRDVDRLANLDTIHKALEFFVNDNGGYPADGVSGNSGLVLGGSGAHYLTSVGWSDTPKDDVYLENVPKNPGPFGTDYLYESLNANGTPCKISPCADYRINFFLETDFSGQIAGPQLETPLGFSTPPPDIAARILERTTQATAVTVGKTVMPALNAVVDVKHVVLDNPVVETAAQVAVAPAGTIAVIAAAATAVPATQYGFYLYLLFTQPALLLRRRGRKTDWGVVYNSGTKLPVDLAIVRLIDVATNRVHATKVTDTNGRFLFLAPKGRYRLEVTKPGFVFPSKNMVGAVSDPDFGTLYFGADFNVSERKAVSPAIPVDAAEETLSDVALIKNYLKNKVRNAVALSGFCLAVFSFFTKPGIYLGSIVALQLIFYFFFRRISKAKNRGRWGVVTDEVTNKPIPHAVVRLFSLPYNKLVETQVSDGRGRYYFLVGKNKYYVTVTQPGYWKTESYPLDLSTAPNPEIISADLPVRPVTVPPEAEETK
jgi:prepilin-type N-terminal cleavage/methylation domain-containing protein